MADSPNGPDGGDAPPQYTGPFLRDYRADRGFRHVGAQSVSVVFYGNDSYSVASVRGVKHYGKRMFARPETVCVIAVGTYQSSLELELHAAGGTTFFHAEVDIQWEAVDPYLVAVNAVGDVVLKLRAPVLERLRRITQNYGVRDAQRANEAVTRECESGRWDDLGESIGLRVRLFVRLTVDAKTIAETEQLRDDAAEHAREVERERQKAVRLQERMLSFRRMLVGDQWDQLAFMLADSPDEARAFLEQLRQEGRGDAQRLQSTVLDMIDRGRIHSTAMEDQLREILSSHGPYPIDGPLGPAPAHRRALPGPGQREYVPSWVQDDPAATEEEPDSYGGGTGTRGPERPRHASRRAEPAAEPAAAPPSAPPSGRGTAPRGDWDDDRPDPPLVEPGRGQSAEFPGRDEWADGWGEAPREEPRRETPPPRRSPPRDSRDDDWPSVPAKPGDEQRYDWPADPEPGAGAAAEDAPRRQPRSRGEDEGWPWGGDEP